MGEIEKTLKRDCLNTVLANVIQGTWRMLNFLHERVMNDREQPFMKEELGFLVLCV